MSTSSTEPPPNLRPSCLHGTPCPRAVWVRVPWGWVCRVCHPEPGSKTPPRPAKERGR